MLGLAGLQDRDDVGMLHLGRRAGGAEERRVVRALGNDLEGNRRLGRGREGPEHHRLRAAAQQVVDAEALAELEGGSLLEIGERGLSRKGRGAHGVWLKEWLTTRARPGASARNV